MSTLENVANYFLATQPREESDLTYQYSFP